MTTSTSPSSSDPTPGTTRPTTAVVTGANKGLGLETARVLAGLGWRVWLGARDAERGREAVASLAGAGGEVRYLPLDVTDDGSVAAAVATVAADGGLDVLVNNAGVAGPHRPVEDVTADDVAQVHAVNVLGPVRSTRAFLPLLRRSAHPRIVNVASGLGSQTLVRDPERVESRVRDVAYTSSKSALVMLTTQYAAALPDVKVNVVDPGYTATDLNAHSGPQSVQEGARAIVAAATIGADGPTGTFTDAEGPVAW